jgi:hypothetical protein
MSISHTALDFKLDQISATTAGYPIEQIQMLRSMGFVGDGTLTDFTRMYLRVHHPSVGDRFARILQPRRSRRKRPPTGWE